MRISMVQIDNYWLNVWNSSDRQIRGGEHSDECCQTQEQAASSGTGTTAMEESHRDNFDEGFEDFVSCWVTVEGSAALHIKNGRLLIHTFCAKNWQMCHLHTFSNVDPDSDRVLSVSFCRIPDPDPESTDPACLIKKICNFWYIQIVKRSKFQIC
jgi:hypothetical protein